MNDPLTRKCYSKDTRNTSKFAPYFQQLQPNQKNAPKTDVKITDQKNGLTNSPSFCDSSQNSKQSATKYQDNFVQLDAKTKPIPAVIEAAAVVLANEISPRKLPVMPIIMQDEALHVKSIEPTKADFSRSANQIPPEMVSIFQSTKCYN